VSRCDGYNCRAIRMGRFEMKDHEHKTSRAHALLPEYRLSSQRAGCMGAIEGHRENLDGPPWPVVS
jgi:hypothetical protein